MSETSKPTYKPNAGTDEYTVWFWLQRLKHLRSYTEHRGVVTDPDLHEDLREIGYEDAMAAFERMVDR